MHRAEKCTNFALAIRKRNDSDKRSGRPESDENIDIMLPRQSSESCFREYRDKQKVPSIYERFKESESDKIKTEYIENIYITTAESLILAQDER